MNRHYQSTFWHRPPPEKGSLTRDFHTSYAAPLLNNFIVQSNEPPSMWVAPDGNTRGYEFSPLYHSVLKAVSKDPTLYELLALVDAIREGSARERELAVKELTARLIKDE